MKLKAAFALAAFAAAFCIFGVPMTSSLAQVSPADTAAINQADKAMKQLTHAVQLGLERYNTDIGVYPDSIQELIDQGYLEGMPDNPYTSLWSQAPAKCIMEELSGEAAPGAIVYHPFSISGDCLDAYFLLAGGLEESKTLDLFYGEPRWDSMTWLLPDGKGDGRPERYIMCLSVPGVKPEMAVAVTHDAAWLSAQPGYQAKRTLFAMQLAVERYGVDNDVYPPDLQTLVDLGYIYWPVNPFYGQQGVPLRIKSSMPGAFIPGGVIYEPISFDGHIEAYQIGIYGDKPDGGIDAGSVVDGAWRFYDLFEEPKNPDGVPDGFIMVLGSGPALEGCETGT